MNKKHRMLFSMALVLLCTAIGCGMQESQSKQSSMEEKNISFDSEIVFGDRISKDVFAENDLTLFNIFAT